MIFHFVEIVFVSLLRNGLWVGKIIIYMSLRSFGTLCAGGFDAILLCLSYCLFSTFFLDKKSGAKDQG